MVERIVTAGRETLVRDGYANFTTNKVAEAAGVSPGSLYQYFPDKASILDMIIDRYWDEVSVRVAGTLRETNGVDVARDPVAAVRVVNAALVSALEQDAPLLRIVIDEIPPSRIRERRAVLEQRIMDVVVTYLVVALNLPAADATTRSWVVVLTLEALSARWVLEQPAHVTRDDFIDELTALAMGYLVR
ncbi:MAG: TetR/AcrR family transcriptional regulator [Marmoricola sp.]